MTVYDLLSYKVEFNSGTTVIIWKYNRKANKWKILQKIPGNYSVLAAIPLSTQRPEIKYYDLYNAQGINFHIYLKIEEE